MNPFSSAWNALTNFLADTLVVIHDGIEPLFGDAAWGWAIIALTLIVRVLLLPLAIRQTRSMRGMQAIQPRVKEIQNKYKVDRAMMRKDPDRYQKLKAKQNEELMALYRDEGVNPASSCLPLILQMPIFFALFRILGVDGPLPELVDAQFYFITAFISEDSVARGLGASLSAAGWPGILLIVLMAGSMFVTQRQMMARNTAAAEGPAATQQKIMMYVFPIFISVISWGFPLAVVLYWVTTNLWQGVQQWIMFRVTHDDGDDSGRPASKDDTPKRDGGGTSRSSSSTDSKSDSAKPAKKNKPSGGGSSKRSTSDDHLPRRKR